jgi:hypothetical protein
MTFTGVGSRREVAWISLGSGILDAITVLGLVALMLGQKRLIGQKTYVYHKIKNYWYLTRDNKLCYYKGALLDRLN